MKWGGIIASAVAGGAAGYAATQGHAADVGLQADLQRQRDQFLAQKQERLQALEQQFRAGESGKQREFEGTEHALTRGQTEQIHTEDSAQRYAESARLSAESEKTRVSHEKIESMREGSAERRHKETMDASGKNTQTLDDGRIPVVKGGKIVDYLRDPGTGEAVTSTKDLSAQDRQRALSLQNLIKEDNDLLAKTYDDSAKDEIRARLRGYQSALGKVLGIELGRVPAKSPATGAGTGKPWERSWTAN